MNSKQIQAIAEKCEWDSPYLGEAIYRDGDWTLTKAGLFDCIDKYQLSVGYNHASKHYVARSLNLYNYSFETESIAPTLAEAVIAAVEEIEAQEPDDE